MMTPWIKRLNARADAALFALKTRLDQIVIGWLLFAGTICVLRIAASPLPPVDLGVRGMLPLALLVLAPAASFILALRWFADGDRQPQPAFRLDIGRWRDLPREQARRHPLYGTRGIMVSLLIGILLNVPVRAAEYLAAMPPVPAGAPYWMATLHLALTLDVVLFTSLYAIAFVAALRRVPMFPRLLVAIWFSDVCMQLGVAEMVSGARLPPGVGAGLETLLMGNVNKVLISAFLWLPYLLLSTRVNVTYRSRVPA